MAVTLYNITVGQRLYKYTSGEFDVQTATDLWEAHPIKRADLGFDLTQNVLTLTVPSDLVPFDSFKAHVPILPIEVEVLEYPSFGLMYKGNITGVSYDARTGVAKVTLGSTNTIDTVTCPNRTFGKLCSLDLFDSMCGVNANSFKLSIPVTDLNWTSDNVFSHASVGGVVGGAFNSGYIVLNTGESQFIVSHVGDTITLLSPLFTLPESTTIDIYYGCNKTEEDCANKFGNLPNFGGFPYVPIKNPVREGF